MTTATLYPVVGELRPYRNCPTFDEFITETMQGLVRVSHDRRRIDVLSIIAHERGAGHGGRFIAALKQHYDTVAFWEITNPDLAAMLRRRGFVDTMDDLDLMNIPTPGMRWDRKHTQQVPA